MLGLAIDTSGPYLGLMLYNENGCLHSVQHTESLDHCASLIPQIQTLLNHQNKPLSSVDQWSVITGPGSFTGLRVGIMSVKALAMATSKPIVSVQNFDRMAQTIAPQTPAKSTGFIWPAQKGYAYISIPAKTNDLNSVEPCFLPLSDVPWRKATHWFYPEWMRFTENLPVNLQSVSFTKLTGQAWYNCIVQSTCQQNAYDLEPWYIQPSYAKKPALK